MMPMPKSNAFEELNEAMLKAIARRTGATENRVRALADTIHDREITLTDFVRLVEQDIAGGR